MLKNGQAYFKDFKRVLKYSYHKIFKAFLTIVQH